MNRVKVRSLSPSQPKSLLTFKLCLKSVVSCLGTSVSVVYLRTVSSKVHGIEQN